MKITLNAIRFPTFATVQEERPSIPASEYVTRLEALYERAQCDWVVVYGDREHYANLVYLANLDPRFEEALLLLGPEDQRYLVLGNEDSGYTSVVPYEIETLLCQSFSLPGQKRDSAPRLDLVLHAAGLRPGDTVGVVGWKYLEPPECSDPGEPAFVPAFILRAIRQVILPQGRLRDITSLVTHPEGGLRSANSAAQIAAFEWAARLSSAGVFNILRGSRPGMTEYDACRLMNYAGYELSVHPILASSKTALNGLRSPTAKIIDYGDAISCAIGLWGSLSCRAGLMVGSPIQSFFDQVISPYFTAVATWYQTVHIGIDGGTVSRAVSEAFGPSRVGPALNPGHLGSFDEWSHTPIRPGSPDRLCSGAVFQVDIIPTPMLPGEALNCEDTVAIADAGLRAELRAHYPEMWQRIQARRELIIEQIGIPLAEEILPLTDGTACLPPFWLADRLVCTVDP